MQRLSKVYAKMESVERRLHTDVSRLVKFIETDGEPKKTDREENATKTCIQMNRESKAEVIIQLDIHRQNRL